MEDARNLSKLYGVQDYKQTHRENFPPPTVNQPLEKTFINYSPNNPPWSSLAAFAVWVLSVFLIAVIPSIGVLIYLASKGVDFKDPQALASSVQDDPNAILVNIILIIPIHIITLAFSWLVVTNSRKYSFREMLGWQWGGFNILHLAGIVVLFLILSVILNYIFGPQETDLTKILKSSRTAVFVVAFMATFTAPLVEEVIYRGILYSAFQRSFGVSAAVALVTMLFAGVHFLQYWNSPVALFLITLLSLAITLVRAKSGNLLPCIVLHTIFNGIQSLFMILQPYIEDAAKENPSFIFRLFQ